jgi:hypothetical protein
MYIVVFGEGCVMGIGLVARGIYAPVLAASPGGVPKVFYDQLPLDARGFLEEQARSGLRRLRDGVSEEMLKAAEGLVDPESIFVAMLDVVLRGDKPHEV